LIANLAASAAVDTWIASGTAAAAARNRITARLETCSAPHNCKGLFIARTSGFDGIDTPI
jgi:hypothetical protein